MASQLHSKYIGGSGKGSALEEAKIDAQISIGTVKNVGESSTPDKAVTRPTIDNRTRLSFQDISRNPYKPLVQIKNSTITNPLSVLVAEDDPVNSMIMKKRMERLGYKVHLTVNGEQCADAFRENRNGYDVVLMDIQVYYF